jgi:hypothetical protein
MFRIRFFRLIIYDHQIQRGVMLDQSLQERESQIFPVINADYDTADFHE